MLSAFHTHIYFHIPPHFYTYSHLYSHSCTRCDTCIRSVSVYTCTHTHTHLDLSPSARSVVLLLLFFFYRYTFCSCTPVCVRMHPHHVRCVHTPARALSCEILEQGRKAHTCQHSLCMHLTRVWTVLFNHTRDPLQNSSDKKPIQIATKLDVFRVGSTKIVAARLKQLAPRIFL